ncbi:terminase large subunit domain-containing protein [Actinoplanes sp. NPDC051859]|uniref:terminase large subunit domain-containing protein n=1 Tax=Actinoplanes sp. NPDC051859 TaxID=3363909 RepID=UPI00379AB463
MGAFPDPAMMSDAELAAYLRAVTDAQEAVRFDWPRHARPEQLEPDAAYRVWLLLAGRGFGKTRTGAETMRGWARKPRGHYAVIAKTEREVLNICFEAPRAGLVAVIPPAEVAQFNRGAGSIMLRLSNGTIIRGFGAQDPDTLRGYAFDGVWADEYAAWPVQSAQGVYDMAWFCMREAAAPHMIISTTPKPLPHVKKLLTRHAKQKASRKRRIVVTRGRTLDNAANLSEDALEELLEQYEGTRLGRQELDAELLSDVEGALWKTSWIEAGRVDADDVPELTRTVVSVDPADTVSETSDETGIVAVGRGVDGDHYVLADRSMRVAGMAAARRIWQCYLDVDADLVIYEGSSAWMRDILVDAWTAMQAEGLLPGGDAPLDVVQARVSKRVRAEPVAARYEVDPPRVHHVGTMAKLEDQLTTWTPESGHSPDRLDALVHGVAYLRVREARRAVVASPLSTRDVRSGLSARGFESRR